MGNQEGSQREDKQIGLMRVEARVLVALALLFVVLSSLPPTTLAQDDDEPNVGLLRVYDVTHPRQVAPSAEMTVAIDVEYGIRSNATIRSAMFDGSLGSLGKELWQSEQEVVSGGGDKRWNVTLTAPSTEGEWALTVIAYYREAGEWKYYPETETYRGPGVVQMTIKVAALAALQIDLGAANIPLTIDGSSATTTALGSVIVQLPVGVSHHVAVEPVVSVGDSARLVFVGWEDGMNLTQRSLILDGDAQLVGTYREQYLLEVNSAVAAYSQSSWYDAGTIVTLRADAVVPLGGILGTLGLRYVFNGWSGHVESGANAINVTMDQPKVIDANFAIDFKTVAIPAILAVGMIAAVALVTLRARRKPEMPPVEEEPAGQSSATKFCDGCGEAVEDSWEHCTHCGRTLQPSQSPENESGT